MLRFHRAMLVVVLISCCVGGLSGCVELTELVDAILGPPGDGPPSDGGGLPRVRLTVSNPSPQLSEEVLLVCSDVPGSPSSDMFAFSPAGLLSPTGTPGQAVFIVSQSDIGVEFAFTCTGRNDSGTSLPSSPQSFIPS